MSREEIEDILLFIGFKIDEYYGFVYKPKGTKWEIVCGLDKSTIRFVVYYEKIFECHEILFKNCEFDLNNLVKSIKFNCKFPEEELANMILRSEREKKIKFII